MAAMVEPWASFRNETVHRIILEEEGIRLVLSDFGMDILDVIVPDSAGRMRDIALGYPDFEKYRENHPMFGATVGRVINRISNAEFELGGKIYHLAENRGRHNIHSDKVHGFHQRLWNHEILDDASVRFYGDSPDGDEGFPGLVHFSLTVRVYPHSFLLEYNGDCEEQTVLNPSNHCYFNLNGQGNGSIMNHMAMIRADAYTPVDEEIIPTGEIRGVTGTAFDLRKPALLEERIHSRDPQILLETGFDHNFVINGAGFRTMAEIMSPDTGIGMRVSSDLPGLQFYTGSSLKPMQGKNGRSYSAYSGFCMEPQYFPNSINTASFVKPVFSNEHPYRSRMQYSFSMFSWRSTIG